MSNQHRTIAAAPSPVAVSAETVEGSASLALHHIYSARGIVDLVCDNDIAHVDRSVIEGLATVLEQVENAIEEIRNRVTSSGRPECARRRERLVASR